MLIVGGLQPTEDIYGSVERGVKKKNIVTSLPYVNVAITIIIRIAPERKVYTGKRHICCENTYERRYEKCTKKIVGLYYES